MVNWDISSVLVFGHLWLLLKLNQIIKSLVCIWLKKKNHLNHENVKNHSLKLCQILVYVFILSVVCPFKRIFSMYCCSFLWPRKLIFHWINKGKWYIRIFIKINWNIYYPDSVTHKPLVIFKNWYLLLN